MASIIVRNLSPAIHRALKARAARHGRSTEAEVREILEQAVNPCSRLRVGSELAAFGKRLGGLALDITRDPASTDTAKFE
jgi:plasmid stability protein